MTDDRRATQASILTPRAIATMLLFDAIGAALIVVDILGDGPGVLTAAGIVVIMVGGLVAMLPLVLRSGLTPRDDQRGPDQPPPDSPIDFH